MDNQVRGILTGPGAVSLLKVDSEQAKPGEEMSAKSKSEGPQEIGD